MMSPSGVVNHRTIAANATRTNLASAARRRALLGGACRCARGVHAPADHPLALADRALAHKAGRLEHRERAGMEEGRRHYLAGSVLGIGLDGAAAEPGDLLERALERRGGDALLAVVAIDEKAGDPP